MAEFDPNHEIYGAGYRRARRDAFRRSFDWCQFCGCLMASEAHHWAGTKMCGKYPKDYEVGSGDLTALCGICHDLATSLRYVMQNPMVPGDDMGSIALITNHARAIHGACRRVRERAEKVSTNAS